MIRHVVLFRWADSVDEAHVEKVHAGLAALPGQIPEIAGYHHGSDLGLSETTLDYVVVGEFESVDDFTVYRDHPAHRAVIEEHIAPFVVERVSAQYEIT